MKLLPWQGHRRTLAAIRQDIDAADVVAGLTRAQPSAIAMALSPSVVSSERNPEARHLVLVAVDDSVSMRGKPIRELNAGLRPFADQISQDRSIAGSGLVGLAGFGSGSPALKMLRPFSPPQEFFPSTLEANAGTPHCLRLVEAVQLLTTLTDAIQRQFDCDARHAWLFDFSDGQSKDLEHHQDAIRASREAQNVECFFFGVGDQADMNYLHTLEQPGRRARHMREVGDFRQFFGWLHRSLRIASQSMVGETLMLNGVQNGDEPFEVRA